MVFYTKDLLKCDRVTLDTFGPNAPTDVRCSWLRMTLDCYYVLLRFSFDVLTFLIPDSISKRFVTPSQKRKDFPLFDLIYLLPLPVFDVKLVVFVFFISSQKLSQTFWHSVDSLLTQNIFPLFCFCIDFTLPAQLLFLSSRDSFVKSFFLFFCLWSLFMSL